MTKKNLIYTGCFFNETYVQMLDLLFESIIKYGQIDFKKTRILVMTDDTLKPKVKKLYDLTIPLVAIFKLFSLLFFDQIDSIDWHRQSNAA